MMRHRHPSGAGRRRRSCGPFCGAWGVGDWAHIPQKRGGARCWEVLRPRGWWWWRNEVSQWGGSTEERENEPQWKSWFVVETHRLYFPSPRVYPSTIPLRPPFPPTSELEPPTSLWRGEGRMEPSPRFRTKWGVWTWAHIPQEIIAEFQCLVEGEMSGEGEDGGNGMCGEWTNVNRDGIDGEFKLRYSS